MGWNKGTEIMERIVDTYEGLHKFEEEEVKMEFYKGVIEILQDHDWDTEYEVEGVSWTLDQVLRELGLIEIDAEQKDEENVYI